MPEQATNLSITIRFMGSSRAIRARQAYCIAFGSWWQAKRPISALSFRNEDIGLQRTCAPQRSEAWRAPAQGNPSYWEKVGCS
jgi:hypothetical protein